MYLNERYIENVTKIDQLILSTGKVIHTLFENRAIQQTDCGSYPLCMVKCCLQICVISVNFKQQNKLSLFVINAVLSDINIANFFKESGFVLLLRQGKENCCFRYKWNKTTHHCESKYQS